VRRPGRAALLAIAVIIVAAAAGTAAARGVSGTVVVDDDVPLPGATVLLLLPDGTQRQAASDEAGRFHFDDVPPGPVAVLAIFGGARSRVTVDDDAPVRLRLDLGAEVIGIREQAPPAEPPRIVDGSVPRRWPYSDELTLRNGWAVVWLRVTVDERGAVSDATVLKSPPEMKLDDIAVASAKRIRYTPARDKAGRPMATSTIVVLQWPPYWGGGKAPPCRGSGPLNLDRENAQYRDCEPPPGMSHLRIPPAPDPATMNRRGEPPLRTTQRFMQR
jgi:TonB family protein